MVSSAIRSNLSKVPLAKAFVASQLTAVYPSPTLLAFYLLLAHVIIGASRLLPAWYANDQYGFSSGAFLLLHKCL